ncbi:IMPACT family protein [Rahnella sp. C60]|uniref:IMPACT family protein n=1 Tax=Rahnella perminowiae TaxID=2816244 RepID=A0ABS6KXB7_9GAMM|nr:MULTISPECIES: IMPACT family protein [Rahnella]UJD91302.1 IMPACT family protein [Rahnella aquatilis]MBU9812699.1 IMPACT family protein [Rahnella perminowiae]MBU9814174.1 IMPACT family protein [Rahnella perminowiae]MBU9825334.1 IMPACT family protein [Rahnella perminowiae]MBU9833912.1 IMPACT family protein [Rahnella perminowiae]
MQPYAVPAESVSFSEEIKKSRFITLLARTEGIEAAKAFIQHVRHQHPAARHHCWAFVAGAPADSQQLGFSDDGEPAGTAGKPILSQLMGCGVGEITAVVVRYYGGIMLGTGGLVKAYGGGVQQALKQLIVQQKVPLVKYAVQCDYSQLQQVEMLLSHVGGHILRSEYGAAVDLVLALPAADAPATVSHLFDISRGTLILRPVS